MKKITRRTLLKGATIGAAGAAVTGTLSAASAAEAEPAWDKEAEIVVVGTGTAAIAAIAACDLGAQSVLLLEKDPETFGGTAALSGGGYAFPGIVDDIVAEGIVDTRENVLAYMQACGEDRMPAELQEAFVDTANEFCQWAKGVFNWSKWGHASGAFGDYYEGYECTIPGGVGRGNTTPYDADGNSLYAFAQWETFHQYVLDHSDVIELMMGTAADELILDENGKVIGLYAVQQDGTRLAIKAQKGLILGTGGFDHNEEMRKLYLPFPLIRSCISTNDTGDGHRMAAKIGAQLAFMDRIMGVPFPYEIPEWDEADGMSYSNFKQSAWADWESARAYPHSMMVNSKGKRFANETAMYDVMNRAFGTYDTGSYKFENIPAFWICDSAYTEHFAFPGYGTPDDMPEHVFKFDTLEELADAMGIDKEGLLNEVERFNGFVANGYDSDYHRGESVNAFQSAAVLASLSTFAAATGDASVITEPASLLGTVAEPPFYCCRYVPGSLCSRGGIMVNAKCQAKDVNGNVIEGLYAVGNCSIGIAGYWAGGANISQGTVMSYMAVKSILDM